MKWLILALMTLTLASNVSGQSDRAPKQSDQEILRQMERAWGTAFLHKDVTALSRILAADWRGQYPWGTRNKMQALAALSSGNDTINTMTYGKMKVEIVGSMAFVMGSDDETSTADGRTTSGHYTWTDVFIKRGGRWQAVASQMTLAPEQ
jgi:ketosteroid isomerase-like protein